MASQFRLRRAGLVSVLATSALIASAAVPQAAAAQSYYGGNGGYNSYDPCQQDRNGHTVGGALIGGVAGALLGNGVARHDRGAGTAIGAVVGAAGGAAVGRGTASCNHGRAPAYNAAGYQGHSHNYRQGGYGYAPQAGYNGYGGGASYYNSGDARTPPYGYSPQQHSHDYPRYAPSASYNNGYDNPDDY